MTRTLVLWFAIGCSGGADLTALREEQVALRAEVDALTKRVAALEGRGPGAPAEAAPILPPPAWLAEAEDGTWYVRKDARPTLEQLANAARALPHHDAAGVVDGYRLSAIRRTSGLDLLGIKNGDIVTEVNGVAVVDVASATAAWELVQQAESITLLVHRRGEPHQVSFAVR